MVWSTWVGWATVVRAVTTRHVGTDPDASCMIGACRSTTLPRSRAWFVERGFRVTVSETDYSEQVRRSPRGRKTPSRNHHVWVDLLSAEGRLIQGGYGSGDTPDDAMIRALERYQQEQDGGPPPRPLP